MFFVALTSSDTTFMTVLLNFVWKILNILFFSSKISYNGTNLYDKKFKMHIDMKITKDMTETIYDLYPATHYSFEVSAKTQCGQGKTSKQALANTKIDGKSIIL
jgi:hypothetical protein